MSRKPDTPTNDGPAGNSELVNVPAGPRFTGNSDILEIEAEMVTEGKDIPNRAIPAHYHRGRVDGREEIESLIEQETQKDHPNKAAIGYLNSLLSELKDGGKL